ncbi:MAG TPA: phosphoglycolate phosphatase [Solimonas sp.]
MKAALFDLDGTLVDTAPDLGHAANRVRADLGLPPLPDAVYRPVASAGARGLLRIALDITPEHADFPQHRDRFLDYYRAHLSRASRLFDGLEVALQAIRARHAVWGVVTNKPSWLTRPLMDALQLTSQAACIVSADEVARPKPAPDALLHACELIGLSPADCIYVGDDKRDIDAARAAGMYSIAIGWGYFGEGGPIEHWGADEVLHTTADFTARVARLA